MNKTREFILDEIRRTASENGGIPLGIKKFERETSIRPHEWARYWARFSDAQREAGYSANVPNPRLSDDALLDKAATLARELGRRPTYRDIRVKKTTDPSFPGFEPFLRAFGSLDALAIRLADYCRSIPAYADVADYVSARPSSDTATSLGQDTASRVKGYVYLLKYGRHYKIGRTNSTGRRERELAIQMPEKPRLVHSIKTDDPEGIELYWHRRFADRRRNGEWFDLTADDVSAFRWRKFM